MIGIKRMQRRSPAELAAIITIMAIGALLRLWNLGNLPGGLIFDESQNVLDIFDIIDGDHPTFFPRNGGREPLFIYLQALAFVGMGSHALSLRFVSVAFGILAVPAIYIAVRRMGVPAALTAAALVATVPAALIASRVGLRTNSMPALTALAMYALLRASTEQRVPGARRFGAIGALFIAAAISSYLAARILPVIPLLGFSIVLLRHPEQRARCLNALVVALMIGGLAVLPLAVHFARQPDDFWERTRIVHDLESVKDRADPLAVVIAGVRISLGGLVSTGDHRWDRNIPLRPLLDPVAAILLALGLVASIVRARRNDDAAWLLIWFIVALLPNALAGTDDPSFVRLLFALPAVAALVGIGLQTFASLAGSQPRLSWLAQVALVVWIGGVGARAFVLDWAANPIPFYVFGQDRTLALRAARTEASGGQRVYVTGETDEEDVLAAMELGRGSRLDITGFDSSRALVLPPPGIATTHIIARGKALPAVLRDLLPATGYTIGRDPAGRPPVEIVSGESPPPPRLARRLDGQVEQIAAVQGSTFPQKVVPGEEFAVLLSFKALQKDSRDLVWFVHIVDESHRVHAGSDFRAFPSKHWRAGETVYLAFSLRLPPSAPGGLYYLDAGIYDRRTMKRLTINGQTDFMTLGAVWGEPRGEQPQPTVGGHRSDTRWGTSIVLDRYRIDQHADTLLVTMDWLALADVSADRTLFVHALDSKGILIGQIDAPPARPTSTWQKGDRIIEVRELPVRGSIDRIAVGFYDPTTLVRLSTAAGGDAVILRVPTASPVAAGSAGITDAP